MNNDKAEDKVEVEQNFEADSSEAVPMPLLFYQTVEFLRKGAKKSKSNFIDFIRYYNEHKTEIGLSVEEIEALKKLREMWVQVNKETTLEYFIKMKDQHAILNGRLLCGITGEKNPVWEKYIQNFQTWRCRSMVHHFKLLRFKNKDQNVGGTSGGGNSSASSSANGISSTALNSINIRDSID